MAKFDLALPYLLLSEGGFSDNPHDAGGPTNHGITLHLAQHYGINSVEELRTMSMDKVAEIYETEFWRFDGITNQRVATKLFDMVPNFRAGKAIETAQREMALAGTKLTIDGRYGPATESAINAFGDRMLDMLCEGCKKHYLAIVAKQPDQVVFLRGWLARAARVPR